VIEAGENILWKNSSFRGPGVMSWSIKTSCGACSGSATICPLIPCKWWLLNSHPERPGDLDLWDSRTCWWCGSSYLILIPRLKFVGLPIQKIWPISVKALSGLMTLTSDLSTSKWVTGHTFHGFPSCQFSAFYSLTFST